MPGNWGGRRAGAGRKPGAGRTNDPEVYAGQVLRAQRMIDRACAHLRDVQRAPNFVRYVPPSARVHPHLYSGRVGWLVEENGCWVWVGKMVGNVPHLSANATSSYPTTSARRRIFLETFGPGPKPTGLIGNRHWIINTCGNPRCVNPYAPHTTECTPEQAVLYRGKFTPRVEYPATSM